MTGGQYLPVTEAQTIHSSHPIEPLAIDTLLVDSQPQHQASQQTTNFNSRDETSFNHDNVSTLFDFVCIVYFSVVLILHPDNIVTNNAVDSKITNPARKKRQWSARIARDRYKFVMCCKYRWKKPNSNCDLKMCLVCCVNSNRKCFHWSHIAACITKYVFWE
jgi:hypothetical protein